jgi:hypothetical protein
MKEDIKIYFFTLYKINNNILNYNVYLIKLLKEKINKKKKLKNDIIGCGNDHSYIYNSFF